MSTAVKVRITPPGRPDDAVVVRVKRSTMIRLEEELAVPILSRIADGYTGGLYRFGYAVGREDGVIPSSLSFDEFVDADDEWRIEVMPDADPESADPNG
mgnify:CR=1 FL=1